MAYNIYLRVDLLVIFIMFREGIALSDEKRLITHLLGNYSEVGVVGRPVYNISDKIIVKYGLALIQILDLDEKNQVLTTNCWGRYEWYDVLLKWDPAQYGGVDLVRVPTTAIWTPDITLYNYADQRLEEKRKAMAVVHNDGKVIYNPTAIYKSTCLINVLSFPFDIQECSMKIGSWTYDGFKLDVEIIDNEAKVDLTDYVPSNEWNILTTMAKKNVKKYPCCPEPYPDITFTIVMQRQPAFYRYVLMLPCLLLSSLTLVLFWLPSESPAKMVLGMNIFLAFFLLLTLLANVTPQAGYELPQIGSYFCFNMIMITLSTFLSVIIVNLHFRGERKNRVPWWLKKMMVDYVARIFFMHNDLAGVMTAPSANSNAAKADEKAKRLKKLKSTQLTNNFQAFDSFRDGVTSNHHNNESTSPDKSPIHLSRSLESDLKDIRRVIVTLLDRVKKKDSAAKLLSEWRAVALVLDRCFFFIYLTVLIVSLATIVPKENNSYD